MKYYFISGTSSGIGKALVQSLLSLKEVKVIGISRRRAIEHPSYFHFSLDLSDLELVKKSADSLFTLPNGEPEKIVLINNAGTVGQVGYMGSIENKAIENVLNINAVSPAILMNEFIRKFRNTICKKIIVNISSGAGKRPVDGWSGYCASKAALDMLSMVAAQEQNIAKQNVKIYSIAPGIVDTPMQENIRTTAEENFSRVQDFIQYKSSGELSSPEEVAEKLLYVIEHEERFNDPVFSVRDF